MNTITNQFNYDLNAIGMYIFGGSQSIGHMNVGWNIDTILEMTEDMMENNAYHFTKNYPSINMLKPSEWSQNDFLDTLKEKQYSLLYANNPCSGLSSINKNANINQPVNNKFFEVFDVINHIEPKTFLIENAPTTVTIGTPILQKMTQLLGSKYKFTIIRDMAGNHGVAMKRMRTFIIGWKKDAFNNKIPLINMNIEPKKTMMDVIGTIDENTLNATDDNFTLFDNIKELYPLIEYNSTILRTCCKYYDEIKDKLNKNQKTAVHTMMEKEKNNGRSWDKSPYKPGLDKQSPSLTSLTRLIHPIENRNLYIREYARIMGYPDDFKFYPDECKCPTNQCIAQGVPVNFIKYISKEIKRCLENDFEYIKDETIDVVYQHHIQKKYYKFTFEEFNLLDKLNDVNENYIKL